MTFALDPARRGALDPMLEYVNNHVQPISADVTITDHQIPAADGPGGAAPLPGVPHEFDAIAPLADVSRSARADRERTQRSL